MHYDSIVNQGGDVAMHENSAADAVAGRLLQTIVDKSTSNIAITDGRGVFLRISPRFASIYGMSADQAIGRSVYELEREGVLQPSVTAMALAAGSDVQAMQQTRQGRLVLAAAHPVHGDDGSILRVVSFSYDMTDLQVLRDEYERLQHSIMRRPDGDRPAATAEIGGFRFRSSSMGEICKLVQRIAPTDSNVLLLGESGVGKSVFARLIHQLCRRRSARLVEINCSAIPEGLFESELYGYTSGAFTGARTGGKPGLIEQADGGTLFLDEIADTPLPAQAKLLKVLQDHRVARIGSLDEREVDFRLITATNRNLKELVDKGQFRLDLYYRINVIPISIPPLRLRREDIPQLVDEFLGRCCRRYGAEKRIDSTAMNALVEYGWPGNVRELENLLERLYLSTADVELRLSPELLPDLWDGSSPEAASASRPDPIRHEPVPSTLPEAIARVETDMLRRARQEHGSTHRMARVLGISQPSVVRKLRKYGI
jgi:TyrR family helix-turn-helix protein/PAS domain S-box-containing protein